MPRAGTAKQMSECKNALLGDTIVLDQDGWSAKHQERRGVLSDGNADTPEKGGSGFMAIMLRFLERYSSEEARVEKGGQLLRIDSLARDGEWDGSPEWGVRPAI